MVRTPSGIAPERAKMVDHLRTRAGALSLGEIRARTRVAAAELDGVLADITAAEARWQPPDGGWTIAQSVDHVAQSTIRVVDELRRLLEGRRPPAPPVYDGLVSGAALWAPWEEILEGLRSANEEFDALLASATDATNPMAGGQPLTVRTVLVVNRQRPDGGVKPEIFVEELTWKEYALVQRLHLLDHRSQVRALRAALRG